MLPNIDYLFKSSSDSNALITNSSNTNDNSTFHNSLFDLNKFDRDFLLQNNNSKNLGLNKETNSSNKETFMQIDASSTQTFDSGVNTQTFNLDIKNNNGGVQYTKTNVTGLSQSLTQSINTNIKPFENINLNTTNSQTDYANCPSSISSAMYATVASNNLLKEGNLTLSGTFGTSNQNGLNNNIQTFAVSGNNQKDDEDANNGFEYSANYTEYSGATPQKVTGAEFNFTTKSKTSIQTSVSDTQILDSGMDTQTYVLGVKNDNAGIAYIKSNTTGSMQSSTQEIDANVNFKNTKLSIADIESDGVVTYSAKLTYKLENGELGIRCSTNPDGSAIYSLNCKVDL